MLESPWMLRYSLSNGDCVREPDMIDAGSSDKSPAADNQQERLIKIGWITGFVDGEGCFSVHFVRQPERVHRKGYKTGFQVAHGFVVTQGAKSAECLYMLKNFFGVGRVYVNRRYDNHKEDLFQYIVVKRIDLLQTIIPFFQQNPLRTSKESDFLKFVKCMRLIEVNAHLTVGGLLEIAEITQTMNHCKPRTEMIRILRDYTPNTDSLSVKI
jgi:hypothetical protein